MVRVDLLCLGTGKASTHIYHGEPSTGFVVIQDGEPVLLIGAGLGVIRSCVHYCKKVPDTIYISHNHSDHAGELPLLLSVEAGKGRRKRVAAEPEVMTRILNHRLAEYHESINLSNRKLSDLAEFIDCPEQELTHVTTNFSIVPHKSQHSERCHGFVLYYMERPVLGWSADSGYDVNFYNKLAEAPVMVLDARQTGSYDHAGFENVIEYEQGLAQHCDQNGEQRVAIYVTAYGTQAEIPTVPQALRIGQTLVLHDDLSPPALPVPPGPVPAHDYGGATTPRGGVPQVPSMPVHAAAAAAAPAAAYQGSAPPRSPARTHGGGGGGGASPASSVHRGRPSAGPASHYDQRSADIKSFLHSMGAADAAGGGAYYDDDNGEEDANAYHFPLPGQRSSEPHRIRRFPNPAPGPRKIFVFNNESKGAPSRMFLIKNVRTLDQLKLKVADTLNIKPIKHLYRLDGTVLKHLDEIPHMAELVATKHAGAPFDIDDLPLHVKVGRPTTEY